MLMLGLIGEAERMEETVIGDALNLASRVEGLTKTYGAPVVITQNTLARLTDCGRYQIRFLDWVKVKGKNNAVPIYGIADSDPAEVREAKARTLASFSEAVARFSLRDRSDSRRRGRSPGAAATRGLLRASHAAAG